MNFKSLCRFGFKLVLTAWLWLPSLAVAQFSYSQYGDTLAGFRKTTGGHSETTEIVANLGNVTNFLLLPAGNTMTITNVNPVALTNMCPDGFNYLQWSVFSAIGTQSPWTNALGVFPASTTWYTVPRTNVNVQTTPVNRFTPAIAPNLGSLIISVGSGAIYVSGNLSTTNVNNNTVLVAEPISFGPTFILDAYIGANGDFGGQVLQFSVENNTSNSFTAPVVSDFYQNVPASSPNPHYGKSTDPITGLTNGPAYYVGYFTFYPSGSLTFTRASAVTAPSAGTVAGSVTNGFQGLTVVFTNTASGSITNWVWNFGDGTIITNTAGGSVTNTYAAAGNYTVTLTVYGPGGSSAVILGNYIVTLPAPKFGQAVLLSGGNLVLSGTNCPAGTQYRILTSTNVALAMTNWIPVATNYFKSDGSYSWTNSATTNPGAYFRLVSP